MLLVALSSPGQWYDFSTIRLYAAYVDALGDSGAQLNGDGAIDMNLFNGVWTSLPYSQFSWVVHFLQDLLAWSIVVLTSLPVGTAKVLIDELFTVLCYCLPVSNQWYVQKHVSAES